MSANLSVPIDVDARVEYLDDEDGEHSGIPDPYAVPENLLPQRFEPLETRFQHPVIPLHARVVLSNAAGDSDYEPVLRLIQDKYPFRVARLRDLYHRLQRAREQFLARQAWEEKLRGELNASANYANKQTAEELEACQEAYHLRRPALSEELLLLEEEQAKCAAPFIDEIRDLEAELDAARLTFAQERYANLTDAERKLAEMEAKAITKYQPDIDAAIDNRNEVRLTASLRLQEEAVVVIEQARAVEHALHAELGQREADLHEEGLRLVAARKEREASLHQARREQAEATAAAGLLPEEAQNDPRGQLHKQIVPAAVTANREAELPIEHKSWFVKWGVPVVLATMASGSIFGLSLLLLTGMLRSLSAVETQWPVVLGACLLGTFAFALIGEVVDRAATLAAETAQSDAAVRDKRFVVGLSLAMVFVICLIEMSVEKSGIVSAAVRSSVAYQMGETGSAGADQLHWFIAWCIAAVVAVPYVLFHGLGGWMRTRYALAQRQRSGSIAKLQQQSVDSPDFHRFIAAVHLVGHAEQHLASAPDLDAAPELSLGRQRLAEMARKHTEHPMLIRAHQIEDEVRRCLEADPLVERAEATLQAARSALDSDPNTQTARRRVERVQAAPESSPAIVEQEHTLAAARERLARDPGAASANIKVRQTQSALTSLEAGHQSDLARLGHQKKNLRYVPDRHMRARIQDAREQWQAAQLLFDAELARVMRLAECPSYLLWWEHLRFYFSRDSYSALSVPTAALVPVVGKFPAAGTKGNPSRSVMTTAAKAGILFLFLHGWFR